MCSGGAAREGGGHAARRRDRETTKSAFEPSLMGMGGLRGGLPARKRSRVLRQLCERTKNRRLKQKKLTFLVEVDDQEKDMV